MTRIRATNSKNGFAIVYNNAMVYFDGGELEINEYIQSISYSRSDGSAPVDTLNPKGIPIVINPTIMHSRFSMTFAPGAFTLFYNQLNNRFIPVTIQLKQYVTGNLGGSTRSLTLVGGLIEGDGADIAPASPASSMRVNYNCVDIQY